MDKQIQTQRDRQNEEEYNAQTRRARRCVATFQQTLKKKFRFKLKGQKYLQQLAFEKRENNNNKE